MTATLDFEAEQDKTQGGNANEDGGCPTTMAVAGAAARAVWSDFATGTGLAPGTIKNYRNAARMFLAWLQSRDIALSQVTRETVEAYLNLRDLCSHEKMVRRTPLRRLFRSLVAAGAIPFNPLDQSAEKPEGIGTLAELKAFLLELDYIGEKSDSFRPGLVAMYPVVVGGMDSHQIAAFTGIPLEEVELYTSRLRSNGIWTPDGKIVVDFDDPASDEAIVNLVLIIGCAKGTFQRFPASPDNEVGVGETRDSSSLDLD
jgi:hypothetical protein